GVSHAQHAARTEIATRGLVRDLADDPEAAIVVLTAHLFAQLALNDHLGSDGSVLRIRATESVRGDSPDDGLSGAVWGRLEAWRTSYLETGQRPVAFVAGLSPDARTRLLCELTAVTVDLRELRTDRTRPTARAEAEEIAALCRADLSRHWTPDVAFLSLHSRAQLTAFLADMKAEVPKAVALKKDELVRAVAEAAAARRWLPACLRWGTPEPSELSPEAADEDWGSEDIEPPSDTREAADARAA
ncbi:MAG: hypothetical protein JWO56_778, partial [Acidobacteria bacterium]|nr:hypothetical protein [Acidobacteriota bacterium]